MREIPQELLALAHHQKGVLSLRQAAAHGFRRRDIDRRVKRGAWRWVSEVVFALQLTPLPRAAMLHAAALHYEHCMLGGSSALELLGLPEPAGSAIHIVGTPAGRVTPFPGCVVHTAKEIEEVDAGRQSACVVDAVVQTLRWARSDRQGVFQAIWAIQQGIVTLEQLQEAVRRLKPSPGTAAVRRRLRLIGPGVHSMPEFDFAGECARRGFPKPIRQRERRDANGRSRFTDVEFHVNGRTLIVEIDGRSHLDVNTWIEDTWRANDLTSGGDALMRIPSLALKVDPEPFFRQLRERLHAMAAAGATSDRPIRVA